MALAKRRLENGDADNSEKKQKVEVAGGRGYVNKQRVLVFSSRGITTRYRHLLDDFRKLLPHNKREVKVRNCSFDA
jgi:ribosome biogenesis protein BRX1